MAEDTSLWVLFTSSFLAATLLPGGSEAVLYAVLKLEYARAGTALAVATLGNTLGGLSSYCIGRIVPPLKASPDPRHTPWQQRAITCAHRYGASAMLAAWVPLIGDPLCVAAGWLRLNWLAVTIYMALGKFARYLFIAWSV
jgi:membrane protein YqaA with SNARE-associated domain